jgi:imidazoleglycerol-phosphate dehydratase
MKERKSRIRRSTKETEIDCTFNLDGSGKAVLETGIPFFDHLLRSFILHGNFDLRMKAKGDLSTGDHHLVEDTGIVIGETISTALGDKKGIARFGDAILPMDEALATVAIDVSGRPYLSFQAEFEESKIGRLTLKNIPHFFDSLAKKAGICIHVKVEGKDDHHKMEAIFKAFGVSLCKATRIRRKKIPSTKGKL